VDAVKRLPPPYMPCPPYTGAHTCTHAQTHSTHLLGCASAEGGVLRHLQFHNLTCNDCGGRTSGRCINSTSCALDFSVCTCASGGSSRNSTQGGTTSKGSSSSDGIINSQPGLRHLLQDGSSEETGGGNAANTSAPQQGVSDGSSGSAAATSSCNYSNFSLCVLCVSLCMRDMHARHLS
jgi:hypothetical protein